MLDTVVVLVQSGPRNQTVIVQKADCEMHARLAAWYFAHGVYERPKDDLLMEQTKVCPYFGPVNAKIYVNPYGAHTE